MVRVVGVDEDQETTFGDAAEGEGARQADEEEETEEETD